MALLDEKTSLLKEKSDNSTQDNVESKSNTVDC